MVLERVKHNCSRCSHGPVGRLPGVKSSAEVDRPQVRTPDGFVLRRTGGYISEIALATGSWYKTILSPCRAVFLVDPSRFIRSIRG